MHNVAITYSGQDSDTTTLLTVVPEQILKCSCETPENNCCRVPPFFDSTDTFSRFGERFRDGQYSLVSFLFAVLLLTVPPDAQPFV